MIPVRNGGDLFKNKCYANSFKIIVRFSSVVRACNAQFLWCAEIVTNTKGAYASTLPTLKSSTMNLFLLIKLFLIGLFKDKKTSEPYGFDERDVYE